VTATITEGRPEVIAGYETLPRKALLALSGERDRHERRRLAEGRAEYGRGRADGYDEGHRASDAAWTRSARLQGDGVRPADFTGSYRDLEVLRYGPSGWRGIVPDGLTPLGRRRWLAALPRDAHAFTGVAGSGAEAIPDGDLAAFRAGQHAAEVAYTDERACGATHRQAMRAALSAAAKAAAL
jgi:hypothetical protein